MNNEFEKYITEIAQSNLTVSEKLHLAMMLMGWDAGAQLLPGIDCGELVIYTGLVEDENGIRKYNEELNG
jgi:hypothetical protein